MIAWALFRAVCRSCHHMWQAVVPEDGAVIGLECSKCGEPAGAIDSPRSFYELMDEAVAEGERRTRPSISPREWAD